MAVYYKFKSEKSYDSIPVHAPFISVGTLKHEIFASKIGRGKDYDILVTNAQTNEEYPDEEMLIPRNTSVIIRRIPGLPRPPIVVIKQEQKVEGKTAEAKPEKICLPADDTFAMKYPEDLDWNGFDNGFLTIPGVLPVHKSNILAEVTTASKADEDSKIKALNDLNWQCLGFEFGTGRGFGRGKGGRMGAGRGFGFEKKTPPQGYVCYRCKIPGHFIQHCPTNGDPNYDINKVKQPSGIPRSMLVVNPNGSYTLPNGTIAALKPNEAAFEKEIEGLPSTHSVGDLPPELHCPLCSDVMKDAAISSKCCFKSFCDKCIRDYITSKFMCICGATNILADDLLPNKTLRDTIDHMLELDNSSTEKSGITFQGTESAHLPSPSPTSSAVNREPKKLPANEGTTTMQEAADDIKAVSSPQQKSEEVLAAKDADVSEVTLESMSVKEPPSQGNGQLVKGEMLQNLVSTEEGKKRKKQKVCLPENDMQLKTSQDLGAENYMMPMVPPRHDSYWNGMQPGMAGVMGPYTSPMQMMSYGLGTFNMPFASVPPQYPLGMQGYTLPVVPPQTHSRGKNAPPTIMSRTGFEARKADLRRKRENERQGETERDFPKDQAFGRDVTSGGDISSMKSKTVCAFYCLDFCLFFPGFLCADYLYVRSFFSIKIWPGDSTLQKNTGCARLSHFFLWFWFCKL